MYRDAPVPDPVCGEWAADDGDACPPAFARQRERGSYDLLPTPVIRAARAAYYGLVTQVDYAIGRVFAGLQDMGLLEDTLVLFTSDHGEFLGDHRGGNKGDVPRAVGAGPVPAAAAGRLAASLAR